MTLKGTRTGVVVALSSSETCDWWSKDPDIVNGYEFLGSSRTMSANRVSNYFDLKGEQNDNQPGTSFCVGEITPGPRFYYLFLIFI